jgi:hypothetical protein
MGHVVFIATFQFSLTKKIIKHLVDLEWREYLLSILSSDKYVPVKTWGLAVYSSGFNCAPVRLLLLNKY